MMKERHTPEQIVARLPQAKVELAKGQTIPKVCRRLGIMDQTYYRWAHHARPAAIIASMRPNATFEVF